MVAGVVVSLFCSAWAIEAGAPAALAIMGGYCTFVTSACLCAMLLLIQNRTDKKTQVSATSAPNYAAWCLVDTLRVSDAARLWCGIEPGCAASQESMAWAQAMLDAIKRGELSIRERTGINRPKIEHERANPGWHTEIARSDLKAWAQTYGHAPQFLRN